MNFENTRLYAAPVSSLEDAELYRMAYNNASSERRQKVDRYRFDKSKRLSLGAEMLLQYGLHQANVEYDQVRIKTGQWGKPSFENSHLFYNISHSEDWVMCAISDNEIGCDIEKIQSANLKVAERFYCPEEYSHIAEQESEDDKDLLFHRYWTLKESFIKATGLGLKLPLNDFRIELGENITIAQTVDERKYSFAEFSDVPGYCCAACFVGERPKAELKLIDLHSCL